MSENDSSKLKKIGFAIIGFLIALGLGWVLTPFTVGANTNLIWMYVASILSYAIPFIIASILSMFNQRYLDWIILLVVWGLCLLFYFTVAIYFPQLTTSYLG